SRELARMSCILCGRTPTSARVPLGRCGGLVLISINAGGGRRPRATGPAHNKMGTKQASEGHKVSCRRAQAESDYADRDRISSLAAAAAAMRSRRFRGSGPDLV